MEWKHSAFGKDLVLLTKDDILLLLLGHRLNDSGCDVMLKEEYDHQNFVDKARLNSLYGKAGQSE